MSEENEIEIINEPRIRKTGGISAKVQFNYSDASPVVLNVTVPHINSEEEFWAALENLWFERRPRNRGDPQIILDKIKKNKKRKIE